MDAPAKNDLAIMPPAAGASVLSDFQGPPTPNAHSIILNEILCTRRLLSKNVLRLYEWWVYNTENYMYNSARIVKLLN